MVATSLTGRIFQLELMMQLPGLLKSIYSMYYDGSLSSVGFQNVLAKILIGWGVMYNQSIAVYRKYHI